MRSSESLSKIYQNNKESLFSLLTKRNYLTAYLEIQLKLILDAYEKVINTKEDVLTYIKENVADDIREQILADLDSDSALKISSKSKTKKVLKKI